MPLPTSITSVEHLEDLLSEPSPGVIETLRKLDGDVIVLGVGGKMGPSLSRMIVRGSLAAGVRRKVLGVSRFSGGASPLQKQLNDWGIETRSCDLLDQDSLDALPDVPNVVYMAGMKFGSTGQQSLTWAMNTYLPGMVSRKFRKSKIVAFSTGNIYAMVPVTSGGADETGPTAPVGEYGMSTLGRERIFEHFSRQWNIPVSIIRLNYAVEMRYGVLFDMAKKVWAGEEISLAMGNLNAIWQADANAHSIESFDHAASPPKIFNITGPELLSVRSVCEAMGRVMGKTPRFIGEESPTALLNNAQMSHQLFGYPRVSIGHVIGWTVDWVKRGGASLGKETHFETRDGKY